MCLCKPHVLQCMSLCDATPTPTPTLPHLTPTLPISSLQVRYLLRDVWRGFSARSLGVPLPGGDKGLMRATANLTFTRWVGARAAVRLRGMSTAWLQC
jgi:hypothetical protein